MKVAIKYGAIFENKFWQRCFLDEQFAAALVKLPELANTAGVRLTSHVSRLTFVSRLTTKANAAIANVR